jgi:cellulose synthase/poly-beta-1,6-N-acetylglucosamine synthase-like glycosyltransferase
MDAKLVLYALWVAPLAIAALLQLPLAIRMFLVVFIWRYLRLIIGILSSMTLRPVQIPQNPSYRPLDVTVIIPTVEPFGQEFEETVKSALRNEAGQIIVVTTTQQALDRALPFCSAHGSKVRLLLAPRANKRFQMACGLAHIDPIRFPIVVFADDHVTWPARFLRSVLAPFEDRNVGGVACEKRVARRYSGVFSAADLLAFFGCLYLERHNFDLAASNNMDGSVFVISGRTAAYRSSILCNDSFLSELLTETWLWGRVTRLPEDDNCLTRWLVNHGWSTRFIRGSQARIETTIGVVGGYKKFWNQLLRWTRTTWRSNSTSLFADRTVWRTAPWGVYCIFLTSFTNFALPTDAALLFLASKATGSGGVPFAPSTGLMLMALWVFASKLVKTWQFYLRNPRDIVYIPFAIMFSYFHSIVKLWSLLTLTDTRWGSREGPVKYVSKEVVVIQPRSRAVLT